MLLTSKYSPKKLEQILGNDEKIALIRQWILHWISGKARKPLLIYGGSGVGKTSVAYAISNEYDFDILEMNASELRTKSRVEKVLAASALAGSLFGRGKIILIDDVDVLAGKSDYGGSGALVSFLKEAPCPIIVTASDVWDKKVTPFRNECESIEFKKVNKLTLKGLLERINGSENLNLSKEQLESIATNANGDVRAAINDLAAVAPSNRDKEKDIFDLVRSIFKAEKYEQIRYSIKGDMDYDLLKLWIDENIPYEYERAEDISKAYDYLSLADIFDGRIKKSHWVFLKYSIDLATSGVSLSKRAVYRKFTKYNFPSYLKLMSRSLETRAMQKAIGLKIGSKLHTNRDRKSVV